MDMVNMNYWIVNEDCFEAIKKLEDGSVDLVVTSPPYADIVNYGKKVSIKKPDDYVDWLLPLFKEIWRVLKPSGSFILNINDKCDGGYRNTYIYDLISRNNKETELKLYDSYIWHKKSGIPNGGTKRFRNTTEFIFHFCKNQKEMKFYMDRVLEEPKATTADRYKYQMDGGQGVIEDGVRKKQKIRYAKKITDGVQDHEYRVREMPDKVRPDNVFRFATAGGSRDNTIKHPAPFNKELPLYFINLLTDAGDLVVDPFSGIGTTGVACKELDRDYVGFELNEKYATFSEKRLGGLLNDTYVVNQYDLDDNFIKSFASPSEACKEIEYTTFHNIMMCYRGKRTEAGGYKWKLEKKETQI